MAWSLYKGHAMPPRCCSPLGVVSPGMASPMIGEYRPVCMHILLYCSGIRRSLEAFRVRRTITLLGRALALRVLGFRIR